MYGDDLLLFYFMASRPANRIHFTANVTLNGEGTMEIDLQNKEIKKITIKKRISSVKNYTTYEEEDHRKYKQKIP